MSTRILVVEDDDGVRELVAVHLEAAGFGVIEAATAEDAWAALAQAEAIVLDRMLPGESGLDFLARLRRHPRWSERPVLVLTARASESDRVGGLEAGADDYLVKPFSAPELVARIRALLRRAAPPRHIEAGALRIDVDRGRVLHDGEEIDVTRREFDLLAHLAAHPGRVFTRRALLDRVWGEDFLGTERTVDQHVAQLRSRIGADAIETVRGRGYRFRDGA